MASNDVEVLDPKITVEKLKEFVSERVLNRRSFIAALGVAGAAAGTGLVSTPSAEAQQPVGPGGYAQVDVLNLMLNVKYLKATLYAFITTGKDISPTAAGTTNNGITTGTGTTLNAPAQITFSNQQITDLFNEMYYDEVNQLVTLRNLLGTAVGSRQTINVLGTGLLPAPPATTTITQSQAIALSRMLEDLSVQAFATASIYLTGNNLAFANQALAVDGFHAGAIRLIAIQTGAQYLSPQSSEVSTSSTATTLSFTGSLTAGSNVIYAFLPTTIPVVGNILSGVGIPQGAGAAITAITTPANAAPTVILTGTNILNTVSSVAGLANGQPITGTGIPALSYITNVGTNTITISQPATLSTTVKPTGIVTNGSPVILNVSSLSGVLVGQPITGTGIPTSPVTTITAISSTSANPLTITMSASGSATSPVVKPTGVLQSGNNTITAVSSISGLVVGQPITGAGIPTSPVTTITQIGTNTIQMSANATANSAITTAYTFPVLTIAGSNVVTPTGAFTGLVVGQAVTGAGIPTSPVTTITAIGGSTVTLSANATVTSTATPTAIVTAGSPVLTAVSSLTGLVNGQVIAGPGIPTGTTIVSSTGTTITISASATVSSGTAVTVSTPAAVTLSTFTGPALSSPTSQTLTTPTTEPVSIGISQITMAGNATATGVLTIGILLPDNLDVAPGDNGAASANGPAAIAGISPAIYQGFFNTAGAATSTANNPAGLVMARSFGQVLAVLYNFNATTSTDTTQNSTGGFYPYGVSGPINNANS